MMLLALSRYMVRRASCGVFALGHPDHQVTGALRAVAAQLT